MYLHHKNSLGNITEKLKNEADVLAIILGGSIAHGFETKQSDIDIFIVVTEESYKKRKLENKLHYFEKESCTYDKGYIDGKYISFSFMQKVSELGSEPARFAFEGALITYSEIEHLDQLVNTITTYPIANKREHVERFYAQLRAWEWYCNEALDKNNNYLLYHSVTNLILFGCRLLLTHNELLYPYHKWLYKVVENADEKPDDINTMIDKLLLYPTKENITIFYEAIINFTNWQVDEVIWTNIFIKDSEINWMEGYTPIADL